MEAGEEGRLQCPAGHTARPVPEATGKSFHTVTEGMQLRVSGEGVGV